MSLWLPPGIRAPRSKKIPHKQKVAMTIFKHGWSVKPMRFMLVNVIR
jgi:hypothetical protein